MTNFATPTGLTAYFGLLLLTAAPALAADAPPEKAALCATCHGTEGKPISPNIPVIWGQQSGYLYLELRDFKSGARKNAIMGPIASQLEKEDMLALATYFLAAKVA
jgi:cytochrome c553